MTPKIRKTFWFGPLDILRLKKLSAKNESTESDIVRKALRIMAEMEGIKVK